MHTDPLFRQDSRFSARGPCYSACIGHGVPRQGTLQFLQSERRRGATWCCGQFSCSLWWLKRRLMVSDDGGAMVEKATRMGRSRWLVQGQLGGCWYPQGHRFCWPPATQTVTNSLLYTHIPFHQDIHAPTQFNIQHSYDKSVESIYGWSCMGISNR